MNKRLMSMFLVLCMVLTLLPVSAMAEEATSGASGEIIAFASLEETEKTVSLGTSFENLELPEKLTATVRTAMSPEDELVKDSGSGDEDRSEDDSDAVTTGSTIEGVITEPSDTVETAGSEWVETSKDIPVTWASQPKYDMDTEGEYIFTPVIEGYTVTAKLPQVTVTVEAAAPMMRTLLGSSGTTLIEGVRNSSELEGYIESATGNLELKLLNDAGASFAWYNDTIVIPNYVNYDITIDLNGMELSITKSGIDNVILQKGNGKLTIKDSKGYDGKDTGKITRTGGYGPAILSEGTGGVVFEGGYIYTTSNSSAIVSNNGPVTMKGGKISNYGNVAIQCDNSTVTIEDGEINSSGNGKTSISGNIINISGGTVLSGFGNTLVGNTISVSGGTIEAGYPGPGYYAIKGNAGATITLTGGTIKNYTWNYVGIAINAGTGGTIRIPGGKVTVIGDDKAMLQAPDLRGYSNVVISGNTLSADAESLAEISIEELNAGINQYKYLLFEPGSGLPRETTPNATFTATGPDTGTLSGVTSGMKYKIDNGAWNNIYSSTNINLAGLSACTITVVKQGNGSTTSDSKPQTITVTKAEKPNLTPTQPSTIGGKGSIPMTSAHEYSTNGGSNWIPATGITTLDPGTYLVRVRANGTVLASENQSITIKELYTVKFVDYDETVLKTETVEDGSGATAPDDPTREGYTFTGWDTAYDNVTGDLTVTAQYEINRYTVMFVDYNGKELKTEVVEHGSAATAPNAPKRGGYTFTGWDKAFNNITGDLTVTTMYSKDGGSSGTLLPQSATVIGSVVNGNTGSHVSNIEAEITTNNNGSITITMNASQAVVLKKPDGSSSKLSDISKMTIVADTGSRVPISTDGTIKVENLKKGTENSFEILHDLGNGQKITIGKMNIKTGEKGNANITITLVDPYGIITDSATGKAVDGVKLTLYYADTEKNRASGKTPGDEVSLPLIEGFKPNNNANPQVSDEAGAYGFMVFPNADYYIVAEKEGYNKYISPIISVKKELVKWDFKMHQTGAERLYGQSRVDTSIEIAKTMYANNIPNVVLATAENYPDALTGSVLANKLNAPILLVGSTEEGQRSILSYMKKYMNPEGTVYILGGTGVISRDFEAKITEAGFRNIERIDGKDRYETSVEIAENIGVKSGTPIVLVSGENYPDALSASSIAAIKQYPILLTGRNGIPDSVKTEILKINPSKIYIIGLQGAVDTEVEAEAAKITNLDKSNIVRIGGTDRYETSLETAKYFDLSEGTICAATGNNFPDALAGSLYAARNNAPIILVDKALTDDQITYLKNMGLSNAVIFGGEAVVSRDIMEELSQLLKR